MPLKLNGDGTETGAVFNRPAFLVRRTTTQTLSNATHTVPTFNVEEIDTDDCYNLTTQRFTPTVSGMYFIYGNANMTSSSRPNVEDSIVRIRKNGTVIAESEIDPSDESEGRLGTVSNQVMIMTTLNGTSDFVDMTVYHKKQTSTAQLAGTTNGNVYFGGFRLLA